MILKTLIILMLFAGPHFEKPSTKATAVLAQFSSDKWDLVELQENSLLRAFSLPGALALIRQRSSEIAKFEVVSTQGDLATSTTSCRRILAGLTKVLSDSVVIAKTQMGERLGRRICEAELKAREGSERMKFILFTSGRQGYALLSTPDGLSSATWEQEFREVISGFPK